MEDFELLDLGQNDDEMFDIRESSWLSKLANQKKAITAIIESNHRDIQNLIDPKHQEEPMINTEIPDTNEEMYYTPTESQSTAEFEEEEESHVMRSTYEDLLIKKFESIGEEPADGILIAIQMATITRIARKFRATDDADFVYIWVASRPEVASQGLKYGGFELMGPHNTLLAIGKTLAEQNIENRTIFNLRMVE